MSTTLQDLFAVREVARIFGLNESRVRYWAQTGFINPSGAREGRRLYTFRDLISIRAAVELLDHGIPLQRVRKNLQALRDALPELEQPLAQLRICSDGDELVIVDPCGATFEPVSRQLMLDFRIDDLRNQVVELLDTKKEAAGQGPDRPDIGERQLVSVGPTDQPSTAYGWFLLGCACDREDELRDRALESYRRAVELDPGLASAHTNMGNLLYLRGERDEARECYRTACELEPHQPQARYNLANLCEEDGELDMAIAEYRRALSLDPDFADAHFNLALTLERVGSRVQALEHWRRYVVLSEAADVDEVGEWLMIARDHVTRLS
jgi:tetratricopeptide (TPR) repeat protein